MNMKVKSKAEVRAQLVEAEAFEALWNDAHEMNDAFDMERAEVVDVAALTAEAPVVALEGPVWAPATSVPGTVVIVPVAPEQGVQLYKLNGPAASLAAQGASAAPTLQKKGDPKHSDPNWRSANHKATNTRAIALATIMANFAGPFSAAEAQKLLSIANKEHGLHLGSGTPASYVKAFIKNGYFAPVAAE